jgi:hypothetical protein
VRLGGGVAELSDASLNDRLSGTADWLGFLVGSVIQERIGAAPSVAGRRLRVVDATTICRPGADRTTWRLHVSYDLVKGQVDALTLTDVHGGERLSRFAPRAGDLLLGDAGYPKPGDLRALVRAGADVVVRLGWNSRKLNTPEGAPFDLFTVLRGFEGPRTECAVVVDDHEPDRPALSARLVIGRKPEAEAEKARRKVRQQAGQDARCPQPGGRRLHPAAHHPAGRPERAAGHSAALPLPLAGRASVQTLEIAARSRRLAGARRAPGALLALRQDPGDPDDRGLEQPDPRIFPLWTGWRHVPGHPSGASPTSRLR